MFIIYCKEHPKFESIYLEEVRIIYVIQKNMYKRIQIFHLNTIGYGNSEQQG